MQVKKTRKISSTHSYKVHKHGRSKTGTFRTFVML
jgi:hypothetical protein